MYRFSLTVIFILMLLFSCKKDDDNNYIPAKKIIFSEHFNDNSHEWLFSDKSNDTTYVSFSDIVNGDLKIQSICKQEGSLTKIESYARLSYFKFLDTAYSDIVEINFLFKKGDFDGHILFYEPEGNNTNAYFKFNFGYFEVFVKNKSNLFILNDTISFSINMKNKTIKVMKNNSIDISEYFNVSINPSPKYEFYFYCNSESNYKLFYPNNIREITVDKIIIYSY